MVMVQSPRASGFPVGAAVLQAATVAVGGDGTDNPTVLWQADSATAARNSITSCGGTYSVD